MLGAKWYVRGQVKEVWLDVIQRALSGGTLATSQPGRRTPIGLKAPALGGPTYVGE